MNTVNSKGGLDGHQIELTVEDDGGVPGKSATDASTLISDHVDAIVDQTIADETWAGAVEAAKIPVVGSNVSEGPMYTNPDFFPEGQTDDSSTYAVAATARAAGARNLASFLCAEAASCAELAPAFKANAQKLGVPVVYSTQITTSQPNYTAQCVAAQQAHVTAIAIFENYAGIARVASDCSQQGYNPIYVIEGEGSSPVLSHSTGVEDHLWEEFPVLPFWDSSPMVQSMAQAVARYYPSLPTSQTNWDEQATEAWVAGLLLAEAVKSGGLTPSQSPTSEEIIRGLASLKGDTLGGWSPPLTFAAGKPHPIDCWFTAAIRNSTPALLNDGKVTCVNTASRP